MIILKSRQEIKKIAESCKIVAEVLENLEKLVKPGVTTRELDIFAEEKILKRGGKPAFKGYRGYPASLCTSVNNEVIHGIPSYKVLKEGDIIGLDLGVYYKGYYGDEATTLPVGEITKDAQKLLKITKESLYEGISKAIKGNRISDISNAIQVYVEKEGYSVVRDFVGHGLGKELHEEPQIPNYGEPGHGVKLKDGMVLAIEPMVNMGDFDVEVLGDKWTAVTKDGSISSHFEHTIAIVDGEPIILARL